MTTVFEIHPAIGIARVGVSQEFFLGPEPDGNPPTQYRDATGNLKRQAARFRLFQCERDHTNGRLLQAAEITPDQGTIAWQVHLVNRKAAALAFLNDQGDINTDPNRRRNRATGSDSTDRDLIIDPGSRSVIGSNQDPALFDTGKFKGTTVPLGEIRTDGSGRLIVVGGFGRSAAIPSGSALGNFADNDNWHDDTSDGTVTASVKFNDGRVENAKAAWVIACQPDFAPPISNLISLYDFLYDVAVTRGVLPAPPAKPAFDVDIWPILQRVMGYQWVNRNARQAHGRGRRADFSSTTWKDLGNPAAGQDLRQRLFSLLRNPGSDDQPPSNPAMPRLFSNGYPNDPFPLPLTKVQYQIITAWANGDFDPTRTPGAELLPDALTRVALQACAGGAFYPGIEAGRRLLDQRIYMQGEPFRVSPNALKPGELTQSMAVPWQADFFQCTWEDDAKMGWWPAQRPDDVLTGTPAQVKAWVRGINSMDEMVANWDKLGVVIETKQADGTVVFIETERKLPEA